MPINNYPGNVNLIKKTYNLFSLDNIFHLFAKYYIRSCVVWDYAILRLLFKHVESNVQYT